MIHFIYEHFLSLPFPRRRIPTSVAAARCSTLRSTFAPVTRAATLLAAVAPAEEADEAVRALRALMAANVVAEEKVASVARQAKTAVVVRHAAKAAPVALAVLRAAAVLLAEAPAAVVPTAAADVAEVEVVRAAVASRRLPSLTT